MTYVDICKAQLRLDEGWKDRMYRDTEGVESIGCGHNLRDRPISERAIQVIFEDDLEQAVRDARALVGEEAWGRLSETRKAVVCNMSFQLGFRKLSQFQRFLAAVKAGDYAGAALEMEHSEWFKQVPNRAKRLKQMMEDGGGR